MEESSKTKNIRDIVSLVKSGQINKPDAIQEIKTALQSNGRADRDTFLHDNATSTNFVSHEDSDGRRPMVDEDKHSVGSAGHSRISQEDRRLLINKLIEKKRQNKTPADSGVQSNEFDTEPQTYEMDQPRRNFHGSEESVSTIANEHVSVTQEPMQSWNTQYPRARDSMESSLPVSPAPKHERPNQSMQMYKSMDDSMIGDARSYRIAQTEAAIRQEMFKECTFQPRVKNLPRSYGAMKDNDTPFYARVTRWQKDKEAEAIRRKQIIDKSEVQDCTFHPQINRNSEKAITEIRGEAPESANERLYKNSEIALSQRQKFIEDELRRELHEEGLECTFQPQLMTDRNKFAGVESKYEKTPGKRQAWEHPKENPQLKDCTFTPKVKGVRPNMSSAKLYVSTNVVDRLTRPIQPPATDDSGQAFDLTYGGDRTVMDIASFMGALQGGAGVQVGSGGSVAQGTHKAFQTPNHANGARTAVESAGGTGQRLRRPSSAPRERSNSFSGTGGVGAGGPVGNRDSKVVIPKEQFQQFLGRQEQSLIRKDNHVKEVARSTTPNFRPQICRKSKEISDQHYQGDFLVRIERHVQRRDDAMTRRLSQADDCTFRPTLNSKTERMRARSVFEMSRGDFLHKEKSQQLLRLRREQEEFAGLTFQPEISKMAHDRNRSVLRLNEDPSKHLDWHRQQIERKENIRQSEIKQREDRELADCTFKPATKDCPAYVKRIAKSIAVIKSARANTPTPGAPAKPLWR